MKMMRGSRVFHAGWIAALALLLTLLLSAPAQAGGKIYMEVGETKTVYADVGDRAITTGAWRSYDVYSIIVISQGTGYCTIEAIGPCTSDFAILQYEYNYAAYPYLGSGFDSFDVYVTAPTPTPTVKPTATPKPTPTPTPKPTSGTCGQNVRWNLSDSGVLSISGTGAMTDFSSSSSVPWDVTKVKSVSVGNGVTTLGDYALSGAYNLTSISLPQSLTRIGRYAMNYCSRLTDVSIPSGVSSIGERAFNSCSKLTGVRIPAKVTSIPNYAFCGCSSLTSIELHDNITRIGDYAFSGCTSLKSFHIPAMLAEVGKYAFQKMAGPETVAMPEGLKTIGERAFAQNAGVKNVSLPSTLTSIGKNAFYGTTLTSASYNGSQWAFSRADQGSNTDLTGVLTYRESTSGRLTDTLSWEISADGVLTITGTGDMPDMTASLAPWVRADITSVSLPSGLTGIGAYAFFGCDISSIRIPDTVTKIGTSAFQNCEGITALTLSPALKAVNTNAFKCCIGLAEVQYTGDLYQWSQLTISSGNDPLKNAKINFPQSGKLTDTLSWSLDDSGVLTITGTGDMPHYSAAAAPWDRSKVTSVVIGEGVTRIGSHAFYKAAALTEVSIPASVRSIATMAFSDCASLGDFVIPEGVETIGNGAFSRCSSAEAVSLPSTLISVGSPIFDGCTRLKRITYNGDMTQWRNVTNYSVSIPSGVEFIPRMSGRLTDAMTWSMTDAGILTITGEGVMPDFPDANTPWDRKRITEVIISDGVTGIGSFAFDGAANMISAELPDSIRAIGEKAFRNCDALPTVHIPEGITELPAYAFQSCGKLSSVQFPSTLTKIGERAFEYCDVLAKIVLPEGAEVIGDAAFKNCAALKHAELPESLKSVGESAFSAAGLATVVYAGDLYQWSLIDIQTYNNPLYSAAMTSRMNGQLTPTLSWSMNAKGALTFTGTGDMPELSETPWNRSKIKTVSLPAGLTSIMNGAFKGATGLATVKTPASLKKIGDSAFENCSALATVTLTAGLEEIGNAAFKNCDKLAKIVTPATVKIIGNGAFQDCGILATVTLTKGVETIGSDAFRNCDKLAKITIPAGVTSLGSGAFLSCGILTTVSLPTTLTEISAHTFYQCSKLASIVVPEGVKLIGVEAFCSCPALATITLPKSLEKVEVSATYSCPNLKTIKYQGDYYTWTKVFIATGNNGLANATVTCPSSGTLTDTMTWKLTDGVLTISGSGDMPDYCEEASPWKRSAVKSIKMGADITSIGNYAFKDCVNLTSVALPAQLHSIGHYAFEGAAKLKAVTLPIGVEKAGTYSFYQSGVAKVTYKGTEAEWAATRQTLEGMGIPDAQLVCESALKGGTYVFPSALTTIAGQAFYGDTSVSAIVLPETITSIGAKAFYNCKNLRRITVYSMELTIGKEAFKNCPSTMVVYAPRDSAMAAYAKKITGWRVVYIEPAP